MAARSHPSRSLVGPLRMVCRVDVKAFGRGHIRVMTLQCGHQVEHIGRRDLVPGKLTGCAECKQFN